MAIMPWPVFNKPIKASQHNLSSSLHLGWEQGENLDNLTCILALWAFILVLQATFSLTFRSDPPCPTPRHKWTSLPLRFLVPSYLVVMSPSWFGSWYSGIWYLTEVAHPLKDWSIFKTCCLFPDGQLLYNSNMQSNLFNKHTKHLLL